MHYFLSICEPCFQDDFSYSTTQSFEIITTLYEKIRLIIGLIRLAVETMFLKNILSLLEVIFPDSNSIYCGREYFAFYSVVTPKSYW